MSLTEQVDRFGEAWFSPENQEALAACGRRVAGVDGLIVEVGSWAGRSTVALANAVHPRVVHAVDTWAGSPGEVSADLAAERDVFAQFLANVADLTAGNVEPHRMGWREYIPTITGPVALAFIDAEHTYVEVRDNVTALLPLMAAGGILCGDDAHHPPVIQALNETLPGWRRVGTNAWEWTVPTSDLEAEYRRLCATPSDIWLHLPKMVELVHQLNASHVIELGSRTGVSTIAWLHALTGTQGRLTSVDIDTRPDIGEHPHWTFVQGDDLDPMVLAGLDPADIVFLDTSHLWEQTRRELDAYRWLVKPGGVMCGHDSELAWPEGAQSGDPRFPVKRAVKEFVTANGLEWMNFPECWGFWIVKGF